MRGDVDQLPQQLPAYAAGLLRLDFGTYFEAFILSGTLLIGAAFMVLLIGSGRNRREGEIVPATAV